MTQKQLARKLGVTQAYLSLMETGQRAVSANAVKKLVAALGLPASVLPLPAEHVMKRPVSGLWVASCLGKLGYPGFAYLKKSGSIKNPVEVLLRALCVEELEPRLAEALPWLLLEHEGLDIEETVAFAKERGLQNRLGFTVSLAAQAAEVSPGYTRRLKDLRKIEAALEPSRLAREDCFGRRPKSEAMRRWLCDHRSESAAHWNLLTDLKVKHLRFLS
ncbi:MAG: helix-turn-helix transcriptional regulator [Acidobacteria bacterium]|uniref:Helix-turn-helix transcriptional regulator n=1 Tax=Candidatus Polarisedimenticola svalbardensis TaxID=2886004 RepID=A0A8J6XX90_9BACT|nr:helix-turn-helix transcriptional regulator [Candidatus Polarisedimenticola svalbardensis]